MGQIKDFLWASFIFIALIAAALLFFALMVLFLKKYFSASKFGPHKLPAAKSLPEHIFLQGFQDARLPQNLRPSCFSLPQASAGCLGSRYHVHKVFGGPGKSGMGIVFVAYDYTAQRVVALKTFQDEISSLNNLKAIFQQEAITWIKLEKHPSIVQALRVEEIEGRLYIVLEYIAPDGRGRNTLAHYLPEISPALVFRWAVEICEGMIYASKHRITCHRDLKPDNIMITADLKAKITDFGLARIFDKLPPETNANAKHNASGRLQCYTTRDGDGCGSPPWMAPEQFYNASQSNVRNDVYSFGVILFQMATGGCLPFYGETIEDYFYQQKTKSVPRLNTPFSPVIQRCMEKDPVKRYPHFKAIRKDLLRLARIAGCPVRRSWFIRRKISAAEFFNWGESLRLLNRLGEALAYYDLALHHDPYNAAVWNSKGRCLNDLGRSKEALSCFEWAIRIDDRYSNAWLNLAVCSESNHSSLPAVDAWQHYLDVSRNIKDSESIKEFVEERIKTLTR
ncbi:MAG: serine/threonine-protein kinase [Candidatus Omnitrophota bacterium]